MLKSINLQPFKKKSNILKLILKKRKKETSLNYNEMVAVFQEKIKKDFQN